MTPNELISIWTGSMGIGNFLLPKHDPASLSTTYKDFRSVLTPQMSSSLMGFIASGQYELTEYENNNPRHTKPYFTIRPLTSSFSVVGSGVPSGSNAPSNSLDRLVIVSGSGIGWHCFAEDSNKIAAEAASGGLSYVSLLISATASTPVTTPCVPAASPPTGSPSLSATPAGTGGTASVPQSGSVSTSGSV